MGQVSGFTLRKTLPFKPQMNITQQVMRHVAALSPISLLCNLPNWWPVDTRQPPLTLIHAVYDYAHIKPPA